ncbi:MAG: MerR family transcriptional regulator [Gordonibacter sp.]
MSDKRSKTLREQARAYTPHELAELSGCTVRTLHHYDELGLVRAERGDNNYRRYGPAAVDRLQQVLLYREAEVPLADIKRLLDDPAFDAREALSGHLRDLRSRRERIDKLIASVESTLAGIEGGAPMSDTQKFEAFKKDLIDQNEEKYGEEVRERWGEDAADASNAKMAGMTEDQWGRTQELQRQISEELLAGMEAGDPAGEHAQRAADLHRQWLCAFWKDGTYSKQAHAGLAEMYVADERFKAHYEAIAPGAAEFLRDAVKAYCA